MRLITYAVRKTNERIDFDTTSVVAVKIKYAFKTFYGNVVWLARA